MKRRFTAGKVFALGAAGAAAFAVLLGAAFFCAFPKSFVEAFKIPTAAMTPALVPGDHLLVSKLRYGFRTSPGSVPLFWKSEPERSDIVVLLHSDAGGASGYSVKRVIGLPGENVEVRGAQVMINGTILTESYADWSDNESGFGPAIIPPDSYFVLGDNRAHSRDSRHWNPPFVRRDDIVGRAFLIYWNPEEPSRAFVEVK